MDEIINKVLFFTNIYTDRIIDKRKLIKQILPNIDKFINEFPDEEKDNIREIFTSVNYISWEKFQNALLFSFNKFLNYIGNRNYYQFIPSFETKSSLLFMVSIAYYENKKSIETYGNELIEYYENNDISDICYIDDCVYSGSQINDFLKYILLNIDNYRKSDIRIDISDIEFYIDRNINSKNINLILRKINPETFEIEIKQPKLNSDVICVTGKDESIFYLVSIDDSYLKFNNIDDLKKEIVNYNLVDLTFFNSKTPFIMKLNEKRYIRSNLERKELNLHLVVPYIYRQGYNKIDKFINENKRYQIFLYHNLIIEPVKLKNNTLNIYKLYCIIPTLSLDDNMITEYIDDGNIIDYFNSYSYEKKNDDKLISSIIFEHKLASPASTIFSSILGAGLILSPFLLNNRIVKFVGPLINVTGDINKLDYFIEDIKMYCFPNEEYGEYNANVNSQKSNEIANKMMIPVYKMSDEELSNLI